MQILLHGDGLLGFCLTGTVASTDESSQKAAVGLELHCSHLGVYNIYFILHIR